MTEYIWIIVAIILMIIEAATMGLATIWFAAGAIAAWVSQIAGIPPLGQIIVFLITSILLLVYTRPVAVNQLKIGRIKTNIDLLINEKGKVTATIDNINGNGQVFINGQIWTARSEYDQVIPVNTLVRIVRIEGVKLIVEEWEEE